VALGDDTIVLSRVARAGGRDGFAARPVPFAICIKDGAWDLLASRLPTLAEQPVHRRLDGKIVRYLVPTSTFARAATHPVGAIVFPRRRPGADPRLSPLPRVEALRALLAEFCPLGPPLTTDAVDELAVWASTVAAYEMTYATLDDGVRLVRELCA
jgi:hypothetical protein